MAEQLQVELVSADRLVWSGPAVQVSARTAAGDIGILRGHTPVLSVLAPGVVEIEADGQERVLAAVDGGFLSVAQDRVSVLAEHLDLAEDIDLDQARSAVQEHSGADAEDEEAQAALRRAQAQVEAAERR